MLQMFKDGPDEVGAFIQAFDQMGRPEFSVDKLGKVAASSIESDGGVTARSLRVRPATFASLALCRAANEGTQQVIIDSKRDDWGTTIVGGGKFHVLGYCDGTDWTIMAR